QPTVLLDEVDCIFKGDKETAQAIRGILNAGAHHRGVIARVVGNGTDQKTKNFRVYCPKGLSGIGELPDTIQDRSLCIRLERKFTHQKLERLREKKIRPQAEPLREQLERWMDTQRAALRDAEPGLPE